MSLLSPYTSWSLRSIPEKVPRFSPHLLFNLLYALLCFSHHTEASPGKTTSDFYLAKSDRDSALLFLVDLLAALDEVDYSFSKILSLHSFLWCHIHSILFLPLISTCWLHTPSKPLSLFLQLAEPFAFPCGRKLALHHVFHPLSSET